MVNVAALFGVGGGGTVMKVITRVLKVRIVQVVICILN